MLVLQQNVILPDPLWILCGMHCILLKNASTLEVYTFHSRLYKHLKTFLLNSRRFAWAIYQNSICEPMVLVLNQDLVSWWHQTEENKLRPYLSKLKFYLWLSSIEHLPIHLIQRLSKLFLSCFKARKNKYVQPTKFEICSGFQIYVAY